MPFNSNTTRANVTSLIPEDVTREILAGVPEQSSFLRLGKRLADMPTRVRRMPVLDVLPIAYFVSGDTGMKQTTSMAWANKYLYAEEIAVIIPVPEAVMDDQSYDLWGEVKPRVQEAFGRVIDAAVYYGTNKPTDWPDGLVTQAVAAGNSADLSTFIGASDDLYDAILGETGIFSLVEQDGYSVTGAVAGLSMKGKLRGLRDTTGQPIFSRVAGMQGKPVYELDGVPIEFPRNGAFDSATSLLLAGDFDQAIWAVRQDMTFKLITEGVITDNTGAIIYNLPQQDMVALRCVMRLAWQVPNPINLVNSSSSTRFPFAVLVP